MIGCTFMVKRFGLTDFDSAIIHKQAQSLIEQSPAMVALLDSEMRYLSVSRKWEKNFGRPGSSLIGRSHAEFFPNTGHDWKEIVNQCLDGEIHVCTEASLQKSDGRKVWISWEVHPWHISRAEIGGLTILVNDITKFKNREEESDRKIEILDKTNDVARIGIWEVNLVTGKITWSKVTREIHEVDADYEPDLKTAINFFKKGESRIKITNAVNEAITHGTSYDVELELVTAKGNSVWARSIGQAEFENGKCKRLYGVFQDLTEKKRAERLIAEERKLLKTVIDNIPLNIYMKDLQSRKVLVNKRELEYMGEEDEQAIIGKSDHDLFPPESAAISVEEDQRVFSTGEPIEGLETYNFFDKDETGTWFVTSKIPLRNENNEITGLLGIGFDITDRKLAETKVAELNNELRSILDATSEISIIGTNLDGVITHFNKGAEHLLGYQSQEVIGKETPLIFHDKNELENKRSELSASQNRAFNLIDIFREQAEQHARGETPLPRECTYVRKGGETFKVQLVITAIRNEKGEVVGALSVAADISERVENHRKLMAAKSDLEVLTQRLTSQNVQLANFAHITSHNLRAPVSNLNSLLHIYKTSQTEEDKKLIFGKFEKVIHHLSSTLNSLVDALKIREESNKELASLRFERLFEKTQEILTAQISDSKAQIVADFSQAPEITYNETYLESILLNLLTNAMKYRSPDRAPMIKIDTRMVNGKTVLTIKDNGLGIDLEKHGHKLFGLNKTFHRHAEAKGVGLYITKTQVESMGGTISAESEPGKGATFTIIF